MAGWFTALKFIPWAEVIRHAPEVADGARKLWSTVGRKAPGQQAPEDPSGAQPIPPAEEGSPAALEARVATLESVASDLHGQMLASSELIKALADQNAQLIQRIESNRQRIVWLAAASAVFGVVALVALALSLGGGA